MSLKLYKKIIEFSRILLIFVSLGELSKGVLGKRTGSENEMERRTSRTNWIEGASTVVSSASFTVGETTPKSSMYGNKNHGKQQGTGSSGLSSMRPLGASGRPSHNNHQQYTRPQSSAGGGHSRNREPSGTYFMDNKCFGRQCQQRPSNPLNNNKQNSDEWESYYSTLNKGVDPKFWKKERRTKNIMARDINGSNVKGITSASVAVPFRVTFDGRRRQPHAISLRRTTGNVTTSEPGWVRLDPILPSAYEKLRMNEYNESLSKKEHEKEGKTAMFSNRLGEPREEISPQSFAERWGWGQKRKIGKLPQWLVQLNNNAHKYNKVSNGLYDHKYGSDNRKWVKLEPIPVAGVSISKWVPKGTPTEDLPTTGLSHRDKPQAWWDRVDSATNKYHESTSLGIKSYGWPKKNTKVVTSSWAMKKKPTSQWGDVVYPKGPLSATASWLAHQNLQSSTPSSPNYSSWGSSVRGPTTGSWSASRRRRPHPSYPPVSNHKDIQTSSSKPDYDDPRWVLVSQSRPLKLTVDGTKKNGHSFPNYLSKLHPNFDRNKDFPFYETSGNRDGKKMFGTYDQNRNYKGTYRPTTEMTINRRQGPYGPTREEIFQRLNATLSTLKPVLGSRTHKFKHNLYKPEEIKKTTISSSNSGKLNLKQLTLPLRLKRLMTNEGRGFGSISQMKNTVMNMNPMVAAAGAGVLPATMAAVVPVVLGRKRRSVKFYSIKSPLMSQKYS